MGKEIKLMATLYTPASLKCPGDAKCIAVRCVAELKSECYVRGTFDVVLGIR